MPTATAVRRFRRHMGRTTRRIPEPTPLGFHHRTQPLPVHTSSGRFKSGCVRAPQVRLCRLPSWLWDLLRGTQAQALYIRDRYRWLNLRMDRNHAYVRVCAGSSCVAASALSAGNTHTRHMRPSSSLRPSYASPMITDGVNQAEIPSAAVKRSEMLTQAQASAAGAGCRVPTSFPAEQVELWASYTRMPRVFMTQSHLLNIFPVLVCFLTC